MQKLNDSTNRYSIYLVSLTDSSRNVPDIATFLDPAELEFASGLQNPEVRQQFILSRYHLKSLLGSILGRSLSEIVFEKTGEGKPVLKKSPDFLDFNISHSQNYLGILISQSHYVGLDIEFVRSDRNHLKIAERQFHADEYSVIACEKDIHKQARLFTKLWSAKEALIKNAAGGVFKNAHEVQIDLASWKVTNLPASFGALSDWSLEVIEPMPQLMCSVALRKR